ncbi:MAG: hypothetical protein WA876_13800 [Candidatus Acidiferrales bacterium]
MALILASATVRLPFAFAQTQPEAKRLFLAQKYDSGRVSIVFDAVQFDGTIPPDLIKHARVLEQGLLDLDDLPAKYMSELQSQPNAVPFALGDKYLVLGGNGLEVPVTLRTLTGEAADEGVGNDSYIGALATTDRQDALWFANDYCVVRRLTEPLSIPKPPFKPITAYAGLWDEPVRFNTMAQIVKLLTERMMAMASEKERAAAANVSPAVEVQQFRIAGGELRYYARAEWNSGRHWHGIPLPDYALGAWLMTEPELRVLAIEKSTGGIGFDDELPRLLNVVDLGDGRTGMILSVNGQESGYTNVLEYRDGLDVKHMTMLQSVGGGE